MTKFRIVIGIALLGVLAPSCFVLAQQKEEKANVLLHPDKFYKRFFPRFKVKRNPPDSLFIKSYPYFLSVGLHMLAPKVHYDIDSRTPAADHSDVSSKFHSNISEVIGFSGTYRFVSIGYSFLSKSGINTHPDYAPSRYRTATLKFSGAADALQFKYIRVQGFTDINQPDVFKPESRYTQRPDIVSKEYQFEGIHNFSWKKYSYTAPVTFSQRQIKSHSGFLLKTSASYSQLSGDSAFIGRGQASHYGDFTDVRMIRSVSIRIAPGFGSTLIFARGFYFSVSAFTSLDFYFYKYFKPQDARVAARQAMVFVLDGKASFGYQSRRLFAGVRFEPERRTGILQSVKVNTTYLYYGIELGYRLNAPEFLRKFYKKTMPPGM